MGRGTPWPSLQGTANLVLCSQTISGSGRQKCRAAFVSVFVSILICECWQLIQFLEKHSKGQVKPGHELWSTVGLLSAAC